jgi:hypothetical protein
LLQRAERVEEEVEEGHFNVTFLLFRPLFAVFCIKARVTPGFWPAAPSLFPRKIATPELQHYMRPVTSLQNICNIITEYL